MQITQENPADVGNVVVALWNKTVDGIEKARQRSATRAQFIVENLASLVPYLQNTNTVPADLKRAVLLQQSVADFAKKLVPFRAFCKAFNAVPIEGTDEVTVPFYDLESGASVDFDPDDGYAMGDTTADSRTVTVDKRKYQSLAWSSKELRRQPFLGLAQQARLKSAKLGIDVWNDVLSLITHANYATDAHVGAASAFESDKVALLKLAAKTWPDVGRSLFLGSEYDAYLLQDDSFKNAMASGSTDALRNGSVGRSVFGFDYYENPNIPTNNENLTGWINFPSAILFAQSPIGPTEEVLAAMSRYEVVTDPATGVSFEYRLWGNADMDGSREVIECNYGYAKGNGAALKPIRSAAFDA